MNIQIQASMYPGRYIVVDESRDVVLFEGSRKACEAFVTNLFN